MDQDITGQNTPSQLEADAMTSSSSLQSEANRWEMVAQLYPQLKAHITLSRHRFRGDVSYVLEDSITKTRYRFSREACEVVGRLTGQYSVAEIYSYLQENDTLHTLTKETIAGIIIELSRLETLKDDGVKKLFPPATRPKNTGGNTFVGQMKSSPLFLKLPLFNPSTILQKYREVAKLFYNKFFLLLLLTLYSAAAVAIFLNWPELTHNPVDRIFTTHNLFILWILYPVVKTIHEFSHGLSVKYFGGDVTEMGLMLLLFVPAPYVNASDSANFNEKWQRILVAAAGIIAELTLASIALLLWVLVEPGLVRTIAFNTILICGVSTVILNGNPLVRYDGYYILSDLIEIPNLATRSSSYLWYHIIRFLTGLKTGSPPVASMTEKRWFIVYGLSSFCYKLTIYGSIFYFFASKLGPVGAMIGILGIAQLVILPLKRRLKPVFCSNGFRSSRRKLATFFVFSLFALIGIVTLIPLPYTTPSEGVVWLPDDSLITMKTSGIVTTMVATPGEEVHKGEVLFICEDIELQHTILLLESRIEELRLKEAEAFARDPFAAKLIAEKLSDLKKRLEHKKKQEQGLTVTSPQSGNFIVQEPGKLTGRFFQQGASIGFIQTEATIIRTLITQENIDLIVDDLSGIAITLVSEPGKSYTGTLHSENPHSTFKLPSRTLSTSGGGTIITTPDSPSQLTMLDEMFQLDIQLETAIDNPYPEMRAYIRFSHGYRPLLFRWIRRVKQLFLTQFRG